MSALFILLGASLSIAVGFLVAFIWSVRNGQYDDEYTPSVRMLFDEPLTVPKASAKEIKKITKSINNPSN
jgi:cbb3-type cytochrome oxidase maturation protein